MKKSHSWKELVFSDLGILILMALGMFILHLLTNGQYGFHRDELAMVDDARILAWGYVAYPPLTPFIGRLGLALFGPSLGGLRAFSALAISIAIVLAGLLAGELGGGRKAKFLAAGATAIVPFALAQGALFQYVTFDYLWWVVVAYFMARLLKSENPRWWLAIGAAIGVGMMTKYTMAFLVAGIVGGVVLTENRRYLKSPWLWGGVALALLITLPNLIWQLGHEFITLQFLSEIHDRDVRIGRAANFMLEQFYVTANIFTIPLWLAGLYYYFFKQEGKRYRLLGWMYLIPLGLMIVTQARGYYLAAAYPMLLAAGAVVWEGWLAKLEPNS